MIWHSYPHQWRQKLFTECESSAEVYGLKFNELKSVSLSFKPMNLKMNPCANICLNGASIPLETSCRYLGHIIANDLNNNDDIRRQLMCFMEGLTYCYVPSELVHMQWNCFCLCPIVKFCTPPAFDVNIPKSNITKWEWHMMFSGDSLVMTDFSSASKIFVENKVGNFETRMRTLIYGFHERLNASSNSVAICLMKSVAWSSSELRQKLENVYICRHESTPSVSLPMWCICKLLFYI